MTDRSTGEHQHAAVERVLLEAWVHERATNDLSGRYECPANGEVHPHPGVPVADLLEELTSLWEFIDGSMWFGRTLRDHIESGDKEREILGIERVGSLDPALALREAREAASKPKLQEGQEVWVRCSVSAHETTSLKAALGEAVLVCLPNGTECSPVHPDDIKTEEP